MLRHARGVWGCFGKLRNNKFRFFDGVIILGGQEAARGGQRRPEAASPLPNIGHLSWLENTKPNVYIY